ncbi:VPS4B-like protein [Mya arenaria]|uniref:VPS4B-like protein n=1 Tax=Mya arenaria TaxID=6604 RepID=A0ABY7FQQ8_MYAAR|nr:VPS4B-like protein [Mya arenaria]
MPEHRVEWADVKGAPDLKDALKECILLPLKFPALFKGMRVPHRGVLLLGEPERRFLRVLFRRRPEVTSHVSKFAHGTFSKSTQAIQKKNCSSKYTVFQCSKLRDLFSAAQSREPVIVLLDDIEVIGSDSENNRNKRACNEMLIGFSLIYNVHS